MTEHHKHQAAYYHLSITSVGTVKLLSTNNERAFIIAQLQDLLGMRSLLEDTAAPQRLASHIDLLCFSLLPYSMQFVLFAIAETSVYSLQTILTERLRQYQSEQHPVAQKANQALAPQSIVTLRKLIGPHEALYTSTQLHRHHQDWEFDRYSSIGFYLHDRRGDWMRTWRLAQLYNADSTTYRKIIHATSAHV